MLDEIKKHDKDFNEAEYYTKTDHIFIMILSAIMERDMSSVKHYLSNELFEEYDKLVKEYEQDGVLRLFDEMNVKSNDIVDCYVDENGINVVNKIVSRYMDYFINEDGDYIRGTNDHRVELEHKVVFTKKLDTQKLGEVRRCPSCGHSLDINASGLCPYCNQTIDMSKYDYIVTSIDNI